MNQSKLTPPQNYTEQAIWNLPKTEPENVKQTVNR